MNKITILIMNFAILQGVVLAIYLFFKKKNSLANKTLAFYTLSISYLIYAIKTYILESNNMEPWMFIPGFSMPLLCHSLFYCYTSVSIKKNKINF